jgi:pSer/pThr/pTyr-binding forkhead associated (FHA) protein/TolA-binding protein
MLKLIIEDDEGRKTVVPFARDEITVGRQEGNTIRLTERNVSRRHARLLKQDEQVVVEDLGSYNGIRVNGEKIAGQVEIKDGDLIQIGDYDLAIQREASSNVTAPQPAAPAAASLPEVSDYDSVPEPEPARDTTPAAGMAAASYASDARRHATAVIRLDKLADEDAGPVVDVPIAEAPRLVVLNTEFAGREFACVRTELKVGRSEENDISLDHRSLSREHIKLRRSRNGEWKVVDLQSANGVSVNGEQYAATALRSGDVLTLGHVKFRFLAASDKSSAPRAKPGRGGQAEGGPSKAVVGGIIGAVLLAGAGIVAVLTREPGKVPAAGPTPAAQDVSRQKLESARVAFTRGDLDGATELLLTVRGPDGARLPAADALQDQVKVERAHKDRIGRAERALSDNQLDAAERLLGESATTAVFSAEHARVSRALADSRARAQVPVVQPPADPAPAAEPQRKPLPGPPPRPPAQPSGPEAAKAAFDAGAENLKASHLAGAEAAFKRCISADPTFAQCYRALGVTYAKAKRSEEGAKYYRKFLELAPDDPKAPAVRKMLEEYESSQKQ